MSHASKNKRFTRIAEKRILRTLDSLWCLSPCVYPRMYEWQPDQADKMWRAIDDALNACRTKFDAANPDEFRF